jgi:predicted TIM-barrel fold metal-dependent hydrolase
VIIEYAVIDELNRRAFLHAVGASSGAAVWSAALASAAHAQGRLRIWDVHSHLYRVPGETPEQRIEALIRWADRMGVERLILSQGYSANLHPTADQLREENDHVMRAARRFPDRVYGSVYLSPLHLEVSLREFDRCVRDGPMIGIGELEIDKRCNSPELDPIVERAVGMKAPILQHCWLKTGGNEPGESSPADLAELARRHPEATFICAHTGGNWEPGIRMIRDVKNVCAEIAGSDPTSGFVEMAVRELGAERVVYGSDVGGRSFASQLSKVMGAEIPETAKALVLGGNLRRLYGPILRTKGYAA